MRLSWAVSLFFLPFQLIRDARMTLSQLVNCTSVFGIISNVGASKD